MPVKNTEVEALKEVFVTKDYCNTKKEAYVRTEMFDERTKNIEEKIVNIEKYIRNIDSTLNNHMQHMSDDIEQIRIKLAKMGNINTSLWLKIIGVILVSAGSIITYLIMK